MFSSEKHARKIFKEAKMVQQPVAVIVFGVDNKLKKMARGLCQKAFHHMVEVNGRSKSLDQERARLNIHDDKDVVVVMSNEESSDVFLRKEAVRMLRFSGAKTVVGVFVKKKHLTKAEAQSPIKARTLRNQIRILNEEHPPTPSEFDVFITIEEN